MNAWLLRARWWQVAIVSGGVLAPVLVLLQRFVGRERWNVAVVGGVIAAAVCGPGLGWISTSRIQDSMAAAGGVADGDRAVVEPAARRGPVPTEPALRKAALRLAEDRLLTLRQLRPRALVSTGVLTVIAVATAVLQSPWWWLAVGACVAMVAMVLATPARVARRVALLRGADG